MRGAIAPLLVAGALLACSGSHHGGEASTVTARSIDAVLAAHTDSLMALPGVVGTAIGLCKDRGRSEPCIKVLFADSSAAASATIPARLEGYRVAVEVTGTIRPRS